ncbi:hypothetical protein D3C77_574130 [compost metagenome]
MPDRQHGTALTQVFIAIHAQAGQVVLGLPTARLHRTLQPVLGHLVIQVMLGGVAQAAMVQLVQAKGSPRQVQLGTTLIQIAGHLMPVGSPEQPRYFEHLEARCLARALALYRNLRPCPGLFGRARQPPQAEAVPGGA